MFLLIGTPDDLCCARLIDALRARRHRARLVPNPMAHPARVAWRFDASGSSSTVHWADDEMPHDDNLNGVLVRGTGFIDPAGWETADLGYLHAETQAALLGWLWSLPCPVVNRYPASLWYRPHCSVHAWRPALRRAGLQPPSLVISSVEAGTQAFAAELSAAGVPGAVYVPLTSHAQYLVGNALDWAGVSNLQRRIPVALTYPAGETYLTCVVGESVVWNGECPLAVRALEGALAAFAREAGLTFVEVLVAETAEGLRVVDVNHQPQLQRFTQPAQEQIVERLADLLIRPAMPAPAQRPH
jgi:hypothetical protein